MAIAGNSWSFYPRVFSPGAPTALECTVEKQFGSSTVLHVDYIGSWTTRLQVSQNLNSGAGGVLYGGQRTKPPQRRVERDREDESVLLQKYERSGYLCPVVYQNVLTQRSQFTSSNVSIAKLLEPYPELGTLTEYAPVGNSKFNELNFSLRRRYF